MHIEFWREIQSLDISNWVKDNVPKTDSASRMSHLRLITNSLKRSTHNTFTNFWKFLRNFIEIYKFSNLYFIGLKISIKIRLLQIKATSHTWRSKVVLVKKVTINQIFIFAKIVGFIPFFVTRLLLSTTLSIYFNAVYLKFIKFIPKLLSQLHATESPHYSKTVL